MVPADVNKAAPQRPPLLDSQQPAGGIPSPFSAAHNISAASTSDPSAFLEPPPGPGRPPHAPQYQGAASLVASGPLKAPSGQLCHVFICHAGEQKHSFVDFLRDGFADHYPDVKVFVDEYALSPGANALPDIHAALGDAHIVVVVLSKAFISKPYPMEELQMLLERQGTTTMLLPAFYDVTWEEVDRTAQQYMQPGAEAAHPNLDPVLMRQWGRDLEALSGITGFRSDQVAASNGPLLVEKICHQTVKTLAQMGQLVQSKMQAMPAILVQDASREGIVRHLVSAAGAAHTCCKVLLTGISGIGKTTLAKAVFNQLHEANPTMPCLFLPLTPDVSAEALRRKLLRGLACVRNAAEVLPESLCARLVDELRGKRVLLVLDNVRERQLRLLPDEVVNALGPGSVVLLTGVNVELPGWFLEGGETLEVGYMSEETSLELLCRHAMGSSYSSHAAAAGSGSPSTDKALLMEAACKQLCCKSESLEALLARCGGLPMALEVVGRDLHVQVGSQEQGRFFRNLGSALKHVYEKTGCEGREDHLPLFQALRCSWADLTDTDKHSLLDIVWCLRRQGRQLVSSHCGYRGLGTLESHGLVSKGEGGVEVPAVIADFCKMEAGIRGMGRRMELHLGVEQRSVAERAADHGQLAKVGGFHSLWLDGHKLIGALAKSLSAADSPMRVLRLGCAMCSDKLPLLLPELRWLWVDAAATCRRLHLQAQVTNLSVILLWNLDQLKAVDGLQSCTALQAVSISGCCRLENVCLQQLPSLEHLEISGCTRLTQLEISGCQALEAVQLKSLAALRQLRMETSVQENCRYPGTLQLSGCTSLQEVTLQDCSQLESITGLGCSLTRLLVSRLKDLPDLSLLCSLQELELYAFCAATSLECPPSLTRLVVKGLDALQQLPLQASLRELQVESCASLSVIHGLTASSRSPPRSPCGRCLDQVAVALQSVNISGCSSLHPLRCVCQLPNARGCRYTFDGVPVTWCCGAGDGCLFFSRQHTMCEVGDHKEDGVGWVKGELGRRRRGLHVALLQKLAALCSVMVVVGVAGRRATMSE